MTEKDLYEMLDQSHFCALITKDAVLQGVFYWSKKIYLKSADLIQEKMIYLMKEPIYKKGYWLFQFPKTKNCVIVKKLTTR